MVQSPFDFPPAMEGRPRPDFGARLPPDGARRPLVAILSRESLSLERVRR